MSNLSCERSISYDFEIIIDLLLTDLKIYGTQYCMRIKFKKWYRIGIMYILNENEVHNYITNESSFWNNSKVSDKWQIIQLQSYKI